MQLHKNYPFSIGKESKHANVRFFFVVDSIEKKDVKLACCPSENMTSDHNTKPTKGSLFVCQRNFILGLDEKDFGIHKKWYEDILKKHDLWDEDEADLDSL